jgi:tRNA(Ile)-lysidine synthase
VPRLHPDVAALRTAVRDCLADVEPGHLVLVGVSGGPDSLALAAAVSFVAPRAGLRWGAVVVDHCLQAGSATVAERAAEQARELGAGPVEVVGVTVDGPGGPENAARDARRAALVAAACRHGAVTVLLGHTLDDQAETVLLGLARGSGTRSLAGMRPRDGLWRRPLLHVERARTRAVCEELGLSWWSDPHNDDDAFARVRVRRHVLPELDRQLGPGTAAALARTADLARDDADLLDALAARLAEDAAGRPDDAAADATADAAVDAADDSADEGAPSPDAGPDESVLDVTVLAAAPPALRTRVLRAAALAAGCPATDLTAGHVGAVDRLVTAWHGQRGLDLPGGVVATRTGRQLRLARRVAG